MNFHGIVLTTAASPSHRRKLTGMRRVVFLKIIWNFGKRHISLKVNTQKSCNHVSVFLFGLQLNGNREFREIE